MRTQRTAGELAADWWWDENNFFRVGNGRVLWETASHTARGGSVRIMRLDTQKFRAYRQYIPLDAVVHLVRKKKHEKNNFL